MSDEDFDKSVYPHPLITVDLDAKGDLQGMVFVGSAARELIKAADAILQEADEHRRTLARKICEIGDTPREAFTSEHAAAQSSMASLGYELAGLLLEGLA